ncbi:hypothetical protein [Lichenicoccus sp.]|uniref:hypothetical protein n=1 Tax=Lichenicoccus sp. TaxID=2781899 RepID=UPI003D0EE8AD
MTAHQVTNRIRSRQYDAPSKTRLSDGSDMLATCEWPGATVGTPVALMDHHIPRVEDGRPLPPELQGAVIALGNFDGFHIGHQAVVSRAVEMARDRGVAAIVATFDPHPIRHFSPDIEPFHLTTLDQRQRLFAKAGADAMMLFRFGSDLASVSPERFIQGYLARAGGVVTGDGFSFGRGRAGTVQMFARLAAQQGIAYEAIDSISFGDVRISSTRIRDALRLGDCSTVQALLSRPFTIRGALQLHGQIDMQGGPLLASVGMQGYLRPRQGRYAVIARLADGRSLRCTAHVSPRAADAAGQDRLWLTGRHLRNDMRGRLTEIEFKSLLLETSSQSLSQSRARLGRCWHRGRHQRRGLGGA